MKDKLPEWSLVIREIRPGEFIIVAFKHISNLNTQLLKPTILKTKQILTLHDLVPPARP